jgi:hypothetical protein
MCVSNVLCLLITHCLSLLFFRVMFMCQWYCNPPAGSAAVDGLWFDWLRCFFVSVVQSVSNLSCRDVLCMLCFVAVLVGIHPSLHPMRSTITDAFRWHSLAPALSCQQSIVTVTSAPLSQPQLSSPLHHVH